MSGSRKPGGSEDRVKEERERKKKEEFDMGSPVSPLRTGGSRSGPIPGSTSSSSSSSGSVSGKIGHQTGLEGKRSDFKVRGSRGDNSGSTGANPTAVESGRSGQAGHRGLGTGFLGPGHRRGGSAGAPLIYTGGSGGGSVSSSGSGSGGGGGGSGLNSGSVSSPVSNTLPAGNICPSGKITKAREAVRSDVLRTGTRGNYGHGSIIRGVKPGSGGETSEWKQAMTSSDPEVAKNAANELYKRGDFAGALKLYDHAIALSPNNAVYRSNRAAALMRIGRLTEAVRECEEAVKLEPGYGRAHQRLASLHLRLGQAENARMHLCYPGQQGDPEELLKLRTVESHINRCANSRKINDWKSTLKEVDAAIAAGADSSPQLFACRAEALLKLNQLKDADAGLANIPNFGPSPPCCSKTKFFGMFSEAYILYARAQIHMSFGRFEDAVAAAEKAGQLDPQNVEVGMFLNKVRLVAKARAHGNDLFKSGKFMEACSAYGEGLKLDPSNSMLYSNRAACWWKLEKWERSVEDCNQALKIRPNYSKALLRRAASNAKLERWVESVRDYEDLMRELPEDKEAAEGLFHAQIALKKSRGEEVRNMKFGGEVEKVSDLNQFRAAISSPGLSVVYFKASSNQQCEQISTFFDMLCIRYPSVNFLKVDVEESMVIAKAENVTVVPTFKMYKDGSRVKEMICPDRQLLENSVKHYSL